MTDEELNQPTKADVVNTLRTLAWQIKITTHPSQFMDIRKTLGILEKQSRKIDRELYLDVQEVGRRADYALAKAVQQGQDDGWIAVSGDRPRDGKPYTKVSGSTFFNGGQDQTLLAAYRVDEEKFEKALVEARAQGTLARTEVRRVLKGGVVQTGSRAERAQLIAKLAAEGLTSAQMTTKVGVTEEIVRRIARDYSVEIPGDKAIHKQKRDNATDRAGRIVDTVHKLDSFANGLQHHDFADLDFGDEDTDELVRVINRSITNIRKFATKIQETAR